MPQHVGYYDGVNLTISLCLTYIICISAVRVWIRKGAYGIDDVVIAVATVVTLGHTAANYAALANGLGLPWANILRKDDLDSLSAASLASIVTFVLSLYLTKCAMVAFLGRITKTHSQIVLYQGINVVVGVVGLISLLIVTVDCPFGDGYYWNIFENQAASCPTQSARWQAFTALDITTEVLLLVLPVQLVWGLQMARSKKAMIIAAFYLRIPVIGFSIARNYYTLQLRLPSADAGLDSGLVVIMFQIQLTWALAASTLSALKAFTESFNSGFGLGFTRGKGEDSYGPSDRSGKTPDSSKKDKSYTDFALKSGISSAGSSGKMHSAPDFDRVADLLDSAASNSKPTRSDEPALKLRPDTGIKTVTSVFTEAELTPHRDSTTTPSETSSGDDMVILRETGYEIQHDRSSMLRSNGAGYV